MTRPLWGPSCLRSFWDSGADSVWHWRGRHGGAISDEQSWRVDSWWVHEHHDRLGSWSHDGDLCCRQNFWRAFESRGDTDACGVSWVSVAQGVALLSWRRRREHLLLRHCLSQLSSRVSPGRSWTGKTAGIFTTFPAFSELPQAGFLDQVIGTGLLLLLVFAITDERNAPPGANLTGLMIGLSVVAIGMSFGAMHGYPINPARDFGPRLFTVFAGFRNNGMTDGSHVLVDPDRGAAV